MKYEANLLNLIFSPLPLPLPAKCDALRVKKLLNLPKGAEINMIISVGKGTEEGLYNERLRVPYEEVVFVK